jgi:hypothetical protein
MQTEGYQEGDYVVPTDLPRPFLCRVVTVHAVGETGLQVLEVVPLHGPWAADTRLYRGSDAVRRAIPAELWGGAPSDEAPVVPPIPKRTPRVRRVGHRPSTPTRPGPWGAA